MEDECRLTGQLAQVQPEPQLQEPEVEHPQSPAMMNDLIDVCLGWGVYLSAC